REICWEGFRLRYSLTATTRSWKVITSSPTRAAARPASFPACLWTSESGACFCREVRKRLESRCGVTGRAAVVEDSGVVGGVGGAGRGAVDAGGRVGGDPGAVGGASGEGFVIADAGGSSGREPASIGGASSAGSRPVDSGGNSGRGAASVGGASRLG